MTENKQPSEEERFSSNVVSMIDIVTEIVEKANAKGYDIVNPTLINIAGRFLESFDKTKLIEAFITQSYKHWYLILKRDRDYFVKHAESIFSGISAGNISAFSKLFEKGKDGKLIIEQEDEDCISDYFNSLVKISIRYIHRMRQPVKEKDGSYSYKNKAAFSFVDLEKEVKDWNMKL